MPPGNGRLSSYLCSHQSVPVECFCPMSADYSGGKWDHTLLLELCSFAKYLSRPGKKKESVPGWDCLAQWLQQTS